PEGGPMQRVGAVLVVAVLGLGGLLGWKILDQRAALTGPAGGSGVVEGTTVVLSSRVGGRIVALPVAEGAEVATGDVLVELDCAEPRAALSEGAARVQAARSQADAASRAAVAARSAADAARAGARAAEAQAAALATQ